METSIVVSSRRRYLAKFSVIAALIAFSACSTATKPGRENESQTGPLSVQQVLVPPSPSPEPSVSVEAYGPPEPLPTEVYGPEPMQIRPFVLVFSPGVVRGFAHSGVVSGLKNARVPIGAVLGSEMGALIAAIYASEENINHLEWELMKFKEETFRSEKGFLPTHKLKSELARYFGEKDLRNSKIPLVIALERKDSGALELVNQGPAKEALRSALAIPELLGPGEWKGGPAVSGRKSLASLVREAKATGIGPVAVIDVGSVAASAKELEGADLVIRPDLKGIDDLDFSKRSEAVFRGKKAVLDRLKEIHQWAGIPEVAQ